MKIIAFEEHFKLPAIHHANKKANDPVELAYDTMIKSGRLVEDPKTGFPAGIYDLGEGGSLLWTTPVSICRSSRTLCRAQRALSRCWPRS
jgi:hypothetical protein